MCTWNAIDRINQSCSGGVPGQHRGRVPHRFHSRDRRQASGGDAGGHSNTRREVKQHVPACLKKPPAPHVSAAVPAPRAHRRCGPCQPAVVRWRWLSGSSLHAGAAASVPPLRSPHWWLVATSDTAPFGLIAWQVGAPAVWWRKESVHGQRTAAWQLQLQLLPRVAGLAFPGPPPPPPPPAPPPASAVLPIIPELVATSVHTDTTAYK